MKYLVSSLLYFFGLMLLCVFCLILFEDKPLDISLIVTFVSWTLLYAYNDKLVLVYLSAREVIDTDEQELFQRIKNEVYKTNLPLPKVYLYSGNFSNCFITGRKYFR